MDLVESKGKAARLQDGTATAQFVGIFIRCMMISVFSAFIFHKKTEVWILAVLCICDGKRRKKRTLQNYRVTCLWPFHDLLTVHLFMTKLHV